MNLLSRILNRFTPRTSAARPAPQSVSISGGDRGALAIRAGWLIDGRGGPVRQNVRIAVKDGIIAGLSGMRRPNPKALRLKPFRTSAVAR